MNPNPAVFQLFHWYSPADGGWWNYCASQAANLAGLGITHVYLPPAYKSALGAEEPGYAVYDLYDLGEFDQKNTIRTKYGTRQEYLDCIEAFHRQGIQVIADIVLNHKHGGDEIEKFPAVMVNKENREEIISEPEEVEAYTKFTFPGRNGKYSKFEWNSSTFTGIDKEKNGECVIYSILNEYGDKWENVLEKEFGNYDFLMGADIEFRNEYVREELKAWGKWYIETTHIDGFRMDAVKHIAPDFIKMWVQYLRTEFNRDFFCVSEYWKQDVQALLDFLQVVENTTRLFDAPLHYNFQQASLEKNNYDLRKIFDGTLVQSNPEYSVTFVENHDTQPLQSLESPVDFWFKPIAYALILLREKGLPVVFYPCLYGASYTDDKGNGPVDIILEKVPGLPELLWIRKELSYGAQVDYFDHANVVGWVRQGASEMENSGCAVVISNGDDGTKQMDMGLHNANKTFFDKLGNCEEKIVTDENGIGTFLAKASSVSVWIIL